MKELLVRLVQNLNKVLKNKRMEGGHLCFKLNLPIFLLKDNPIIICPFLPHDVCSNPLIFPPRKTDKTQLPILEEFRYKWQTL